MHFIQINLPEFQEAVVDIPGQGIGGFGVFHAQFHVRKLVPFILGRQHVVEGHALVGGTFQK